jgi:hypothetical protein
MCTCIEKREEKRQLETRQCCPANINKEDDAPRTGAIDTCGPASPVGDGCSVNMCVMYIGYTLRGKTESEREKMSVCGPFF